ncbi:MULTISPECIES: EF-hand domain-containing protein [unclassified Luteimonas]
MKHRILFTALTLAVLTAAGATAAEPATSTQRSAKATLDTNGDGVIDRAEAAKSPRLAERFDRLDRNGDGRLEASERPQRRHGHHGGKRPQHGAHRDHARLDTDGDGRLSRAEVEASANARGKRANPLVEHFAAIDANRDGHLVRSEIGAWHERQRPQREAEMRKRFDERFAAADLNSDGKLSRVEVDEKMPRLSDRFAWMDDNRDGFLSRDELRPMKR